MNKSAALTWFSMFIGLVLVSVYLIDTATVQAAGSATVQPDNSDSSQIDYVDNARAKLDSLRDSRDTRVGDRFKLNASSIFHTLFKKKPYSRYWTAEQKWDDLFRRVFSIQDSVKHFILKSIIRDAEYYADLDISQTCKDDLRFIQIYARSSKNFRWLLHMLDATGKSEPGMLTGNLAHLGHVVQCIKVRAPSRATNQSFEERYFDQQTQLLGERFRGKYCLVSIRPVMPAKPHLVSRFSSLFNESLLSNISYMGEPFEVLKQRTTQLTVPAEVYSTIDRQHFRLDQVPFESELYAYLIAQRNFMYTLPRYMGVCYPSSCSTEDIRIATQRTMDEQHQVVDIEFDCEQEQSSLWEWLITPRLIAYVILGAIVTLVFVASSARYVLVSKMGIKRSKLPPDSLLVGLMSTLDMLSMDKCAGILFVKTKRASPFVDWNKVENNRSTSIDALRGFLILVLVYSQLVVLGCLPVPFMWAKWGDAMFPFYRSLGTQIYANMFIWTEAFYIISAYLIGIKLLENLRPRSSGGQAQDQSLFKRPPSNSTLKMANFFSFTLKRYVRLLTPMLAFILLNYVWPQLSSGFVMQDQANKLMTPCDSYGWVNLMLFHNQYSLNETCLWPSHVSASFFQLHLISYPILLLCLMCLYSQFNYTFNRDSSHLHICNNINSITSSYNRKQHDILLKAMRFSTYGLICALAFLGALYPALKAKQQELIVPFLVDYLDYDNYQRVLEWMVIPTYNHLTAYMFGLLLAFMVAEKRSRRERQSVSLSDSWFYNSGAGGAVAANIDVGVVSFSNRDESPESVRSSSTQELQYADCQTLGSTNKSDAKSMGTVLQIQSIVEQPKHKFTVSTCASSSGDHRSNLADQDDREDCDSECSWLKDSLKSFFALMGILIVLMASWFWNGLGQPMSSDQTFWYVLLTKLAYCSLFSYLFYKHFATRLNNKNPWMITRFFVPIGRMSLTVFYISWLVIWFDLLSSPYQWHPSHYFVSEKFTEIIFITLILSMLVYGIFEGIIKRAQFGMRQERVRRDNSYLASMKDASTGQVQQDKLRRQQVKTFESFFLPEGKMLDHEQKEEDPTRAESASQRATGDGPFKQINNEGKQLSGDNGGQPISTSVNQPPFQSEETTTVASLQPRAYTARSQLRTSLSPVDQYKLNAELRANDSFASIGLYNAVGASADVTQFNGSVASFEPQASPASTRGRDT